MIKRKLEFISSGYSPLAKSAVSKITFLQDKAEVVTSQNTLGASALSNIKRISKTQYVKVNTGEVFEYNTGINKADNTVSIKNSLKKLRKLIINNFVEFESFFITLTYRTEMLDFSQAANDYRKFYDNLKNRYSHYRLEYLRIIEPTDKGVWHIHVLLKSTLTAEKFFISQEEVQKLWKYGSVKSEQIYDVAKLSAYFCTYSNDNNLLAFTEKSKHVIKQSRWKYYPCGAKIFTKSKGIKYPESVKASREQVDKILEEYSRISASTLTVKDSETGEVVNKVNYEYYEKN